MIELTMLIVGIIIGFVLGFVFGKLKAYQQTDLSTQLSTLNSLTTQISEMKVKFEEIEKRREKIEAMREKRIDEMFQTFREFSHVVMGTKKRGIAGEAILKEVLNDSIRVGLIKTNLKTSNGEVEFAWDLGDGKYIPIDSKMPDIIELLSKYNSSENNKERDQIKKQIFDKVKKEIQRVKKYQNLTNTIDSCILVVPEAILEMSPELISEGRRHNVFVCSYKEVFPIAHVIQDEYIKLKEEGDIGEYKRIIKTLFHILENINKKVETIDKAVKTIKNANDDIRSEVVKGQNSVKITIKKSTN